MMDASALYPRGFHPVNDDMLPDSVLVRAPTRPRAITPVVYYFTDFGISSQFAPDDTNRLVTGINGLDDEVPELSDDVPYDPFKVGHP